MLIKSSLYAPSVHCSYYAMLQHMTCKLKDCLKISFETIALNSKGVGSHEYVINETLTQIKTSFSNLEPLMREVEKTNAQKLRNKIGDLKLLGVQSDYNNVEIDETLSSQALDLSNIIIGKLNTFIP